MVGDPRRPLDVQTTCHLADTEPWISTLVANRGVLGRRIWSLVASLALVSWLGSWTCSWWGACVRAVVLVCFHVLVGAGIRVCVLEVGFVFVFAVFVVAFEVAAVNMVTAISFT
jgi:hypothetical protein